ncbi:MAG: hypothetical protein JWR15_3856 [Prosthecobacter sp.]|nr:hypothetical protein [Prosthecobacter sp.]
MKPTTNTVTTLPNRVDSAMLAKFLREGEPVIVLKLTGVGNSAPYDFRDKGTRSYIFRFDSAQEGHLLRIPLHLWQENKARLAHDIMDQRHMAHAMIVTLEMPRVPADPQIPLTTIYPEQMGATDTSTDTRNVVGPGAEPTVAPTFAKASERRPTSGSAGGAEEEPPLIGGRPLHEAAYDLAEQPKRLKALAALLGVTEAPLREAIGDSSSRIELATAGWVRRKA